LNTNPEQEEKLPDDWSPCPLSAPTNPFEVKAQKALRNNKEIHLKKGLEKVHGLLTRRAARVERRTAFAHKLNKWSMGLGTVLAAVLTPTTIAPVILAPLTVVLPFIGASYLIHLANRKMAATSQRTFQKAFIALQVCGNPEADKLEKAKAYNRLHRTANYMRYQENSLLALRTLSKLGSEKLFELASLGFAFAETSENMLSRPHGMPRASDRLKGHLNEMYEGLGLREYQHLMPDVHRSRRKGSWLKRLLNF